MNHSIQCNSNQEDKLMLIQSHLSNNNLVGTKQDLKNQLHNSSLLDKFPERSSLLRDSNIQQHSYSRLQRVNYLLHCIKQDQPPDRLSLV